VVSGSALPWLVSWIRIAAGGGPVCTDGLIGSVLGPLNTGTLKRERYRLIYQYMERVPIRVIEMANTSDKAYHARMFLLVEQLLTLHRQSAAAKAPGEQARLQRQIDANDRQIDRLVYDLYGLTEEEIRIVEGVNQA
jgi:hypothetical protein